MVIHEENEAPVEVAIIKKPAVLETKKYVIVKNHVQELTVSEVKEDSERLLEENTSSDSENKEKEKEKKEDRKCMKKSKKYSQSSTSSTESTETSNKETGISKSDLDELRAVYKKCKDVMQRIETKYGHLLDLDNETIQIQHQQRKRKNEEDDSEECKCIANKRIIFDDDGGQLVSETSLEKHVCPHKLNYQDKKRKSVDNELRVEYENDNTPLPDDLNELTSILRDESIKIVYRNKVIEKIKGIKRENLDEIKFNKPSLIEKLKSNPEEVFEFKGANLSELPGYIYIQN